MNPPTLFRYLSLTVCLLALPGVRRASALPLSPASHYVDDRPVARALLPATDFGVVLRHGDGPAGCDWHGAREAVVYEEDGLYHLFYDGAGKSGWRACLATSRDLVHWTKRGPILELGAPGTPDSAAATSPWAIRANGIWYIFYLGTPHASPAPDYVPHFPYLTLLATAPRLAGPWAKHYETAPFVPRPGTWYATTASPGYVIEDAGEYLQFMSGSSQPAPRLTKRTLGLARTKSLDGAWQLMDEPLFPIQEQVENSSLYHEPANGYWFLFTNHIGCDPVAGGGIHEYTDAIWVYWSKDPRHWNTRDKAVVFDGSNCTWSKHCIGMPAVVRCGSRLAVLYDGPGGDSTSHVNRDIGLAWLNVPLVPPTAPSPP